MTRSPGGDSERHRTRRDEATGRPVLPGGTGSGTRLSAGSPGTARAGHPRVQDPAAPLQEARRQISQQFVMRAAPPPRGSRLQAIVALGPGPVGSQTVGSAGLASTSFCRIAMAFWYSSSDSVGFPITDRMMPMLSWLAARRPRSDYRRSAMPFASAPRDIALRRLPGSETQDWKPIRHT